MEEKSSESPSPSGLIPLWVGVGGGGGVAPAGPGMPWFMALSSASPSEWNNSGVQDSWGWGRLGQGSQHRAGRRAEPGPALAHLLMRLINTCRTQGGHREHGRTPTQAQASSTAFPSSTGPQDLNTIYANTSPSMNSCHLWISHFVKADLS